VEATLYNAEIYLITYHTLALITNDKLILHQNHISVYAQYSILETKVYKHEKTYS